VKRANWHWPCRRKGFGHRTKKDGTFVTDVDEAVDNLLRARIAQGTPG
jgi:fructose-1,6-bisphosphatase/inositol monophosphatase family enzyme